MRTGAWRIATAVATAVLGVALTASCANTTAGQPFTRESALAAMHARYPQATLPEDLPLVGVRELLGLTYAQTDGHDLKLDLFVPDPPDAASTATTPAGRPGVIIVHGGGWDQGDRSMERPLARALAAHGFAVASISYRLGPAGRFPNAMHDVAAAVTWMRTQGSAFGVSSTAPGLIGVSAGGPLVAWVGAHAGAGAVVVVDGLVDFTGVALVKKEADHAGAPTRFLGGSPSSRAAVWKDASPATHVSASSAPTLFLNSTAPTPILPGRPEMSAHLKSLGVESEIITFPDTPHTFWLAHPWFDTVVDHAARFFAKHLGRSRRFPRPARW